MATLYALNDQPQGLQIAINFHCLSDYKEPIVVVAEPTVQRRCGENSRYERLNIHIYTAAWFTQVRIETAPWGPRVER